MSVSLGLQMPVGTVMNKPKGSRALNALLPRTSTPLSCLRSESSTGGSRAGLVRRPAEAGPRPPSAAPQPRGRGPGTRVGSLIPAVGLHGRASTDSCWFQHPRACRQEKQLGTVLGLVPNAFVLDALSSPASRGEAFFCIRRVESP